MYQLCMMVQFNESLSKLLIQKKKKKEKKRIVIQAMKWEVMVGWCLKVFKLLNNLEFYYGSYFIG